jgi:hypothetical protein
VVAVATSSLSKSRPVTPALPFAVIPVPAPVRLDADRVGKLG